MFHLVNALLLFFVGVQSQQCRNEYGEPVDWFYMYKLPKLQQGNDFYLRKGLSYIYVTSESSASDWKHGLWSINDTKSLVGQTLAPLYNKSVAANLSHIMYNDDPPGVASSSIYGHTKGVVFSDGKTAVWLVHSCPRFPEKPFEDVHPKEDNSTRKRLWNKYSYPVSATKFGQSLLCITLRATSLDDVGNALLYYRPKIYSGHLTREIKEKFPNFTLAANNSFVNTPPWNRKIVLMSKGGDNFSVYAKSKKYERDLYAGFIAPDLRTSLDVETWMNGAGDIPSYCKGSYNVRNVLSVAIRMGQNRTYSFRSSQDHSKWSVSGKKQATVCVGDINRMESQLKRGGGSVCLKNPVVWKIFKSAVDTVEKCQNSTYKPSPNKSKLPSGASRSIFEMTENSNSL